MNNSDKEINNEEPEEKKPKLWGAIYIVFGVVGLGFSAHIIINCNEITPLFGAITGGVLLGALSIFLIAFGYRVIKRDY